MAQQQDVEKNVSPASPETAAPSAPAKPPRSAAQRIMEHGFSFGILTPAIGGFLVFLLMLAERVPVDGVITALKTLTAISGTYLIAGYMIGMIPSLITGLLVFPLWRQFGERWELYTVAGLVNCTLCSAFSYLLLNTSTVAMLIVGIIAAIATIFSIRMTKRLRQN